MTIGDGYDGESYFAGYIKATRDVNERTEDAICEMYKYADRKNFKGLSKRDVVFSCIKILEESLKNDK